MSGLSVLSEWIVPDEEIDHLGHMSMVFYGRRAERGAVGLIEALAGGPWALDEAGLMAVVADRHIHFRREQLKGAPLVLRGGAFAAHTDRIEVYVEIANSADNTTAAMGRLGVRLQDRATRSWRPIPSAWLDRADRGLIEAPNRSRPRTLAREKLGVDATLDDFAAAGIASHLRRRITAEMCDADGFIAPPPPRTWTKPSDVKLGVMDQVWEAAPGFAWPVVETRDLILRTARQWDVLESYAVLLGVEARFIHWGSWVFEAKSGALVSTTHQVNIFFDLAARRGGDMPADLRRRLESFARPDWPPVRQRTATASP